MDEPYQHIGFLHLPDTGHKITCRLNGITYSEFTQTVQGDRLAYHRSEKPQHSYPYALFLNNYIWRQIVTISYKKDIGTQNRTIQTVKETLITQRTH